MDSAIVLSMFMLSLIFVIVCSLLARKQICRSFYRILIYVLKMEIQLSRREGWDPEVMCVDMWIHLFSMNIQIIVDFLIDCLTVLG